MKITIVIFIMPYEIDELDRLLISLKDNFKNLSADHDWGIDVTLGVSSDLIDWNKSSIPLSFFEKKFNNILKKLDWCRKRSRVSYEVKGCVDQRRAVFLSDSDADYFIWLDCDLVFPNSSLKAIEDSIAISTKETNLAIITPEIVRIWDNTWDCLVNSHFLECPLNYQSQNDPFKDCGIKGQMSLVEVNNNAVNQPRFKFAGGWFTCISGDLLRLITIPDSFSPYGLEDTFIMWAAEYLTRAGKADIKQFKIKNLVVCEDYKYRDNSHYTNHMTIIDRRAEYLTQTRKVFHKELERFLK